MADDKTKTDRSKDAKGAAQDHTNTVRRQAEEMKRRGGH